MLRKLAMAALALTLFSGSSALTAGAAVAAVTAQGHVAATTATPGSSATGTPGASQSPSDAPSPSTGGSTGPNNPGTGETGQQEQQRTDVVPWILGIAAAIIIVGIIVWTVRNRRPRDKGLTDRRR